MSKRRKNDFYPTPKWATEVLLKYIDIDNKHILEPCVGNGDISNVLSNHTLNLITNDIDETRLAHTYEDATKEDLFKNNIIDWTITNPPFSHALPIVQNAWKYSEYGVAMLLRLSFLEPTYDRQDWLHYNPPHKIIVLPRISFTGDGKTDSVTCAWFIWYKKNIDLGIYVERKE